MTPRTENIHAQLRSDFFDLVAPASFPKHILRYRNHNWASRIGLAELSDQEWIEHFGRFKPLAGSFERPLALRYHGHQFQVYNPNLGDGRGFLFAQLRDLEDGRLLDLGTKGSGQTPWSRAGDGRLTLKGGVREILASEMLEALGVNTSKTLSLIETGEALTREDEPSPTRASILVRLSHSHIRIGSFQRLAALGQSENIKKLMDHCIFYYMPQLQAHNTQKRVSGFIQAVTRYVAQTGAAWTAAGFVHGVLNTDNINITGESFDYGPWRFLPYYDPEFTAAYFDQTGLYAFGRQPDTLLWNLTRLAECFLTFADKRVLENALSIFWPHFQSSIVQQFCWRLGINVKPSYDAFETGLALVQRLIDFWHKTQAPFEQVMFDLMGGAERIAGWPNSPIAELYHHKDFQPVQDILQSRLDVNAHARIEHPYFQRATPVTMLIDDVEAIWQPIAETDDWSRFQQALEDIKQMRAAYSL